MTSSDPRPTRRFAVRYWIAATVLLLIGIAASVFLVPRVIRDVHGGRSIAALDALLQGRSEVPLERYLDYWTSIWTRVAFVYVVAATVLFLLVVKRASIAASLRQWWRALPPYRPAHTALLGVTLGLVLGTVEGFYRGGSRLLLRESLGEVSRHVVWMAPVTGAIGFGLLGLLAWLAARRWPRAFSVPVMILVLGTASIFGTLKALALGVTGWAALVFAIGAAAALARWAARDAGRFIRRMKQVTRTLVPVTVGVAIIVLVSDPIRFALWRAKLPPSLGGPNVLFIILDTVRAHNLSLYGHEHATTPNLERFGAQGVVFERAIAPSSWTLPSHATMFTGRPNYELGTSWTAPLDGRYPTLAEMLRDRGYETAAFVGNISYAARESGLFRGFVYYEDQPATPAATVAHHWLIRYVINHIRKPLGNQRRFVRVTGARIREHFQTWLTRRDTSRPFFVFLNFFDAHDPYELPPAATRRFAAPGARYWLDEGPTVYDEERLRDLRDSYDDAIAYLDNQLGAMFSQLERDGILDSTIVVVASDHGEQFGERSPDLMLHGNSLYLSSIHVPLLIRYPATVPAGVRVQEWTSLRDIPATILELAGAPPSLPGHSLAASWDGTIGAPRSPPFSELARSDTLNSLLVGELHYLAASGGVEELYDVSSDAWEKTDRSETSAGRAQLGALRTSLDSVFSDNGGRAVAVRLGIPRNDAQRVPNR